ncbi:hypothetical protein NFI96_015461 [Prochilodus magdalenae]|nr:hypothetical protein NFI96_015461 [Prochilodus magdalenae]
MASSFVPVDNTRNGFTIVTQVVPGEKEQHGRAPTQSPLKTLLKGEPKALGTVQIMIGIMTILFGIIKTVYNQRLAAYSGVTYWASCLVGAFYVACGSVRHDFVTSSLIMNVISAVAAGVALILLSIDMAFHLDNYHYCYYRYDYRDEYQCEGWRWSRLTDKCFQGQSAGISAGLLVFALLEFIISICTSGFACKATCCAGAAVSESLY